MIDLNTQSFTSIPRKRFGCIYCFYHLIGSLYMQNVFVTKSWSVIWVQAFHLVTCYSFKCQDPLHSLSNHCKYMLHIDKINRKSCNVHIQNLKIFRVINFRSVSQSLYHVTIFKKILFLHLSLWDRLFFFFNIV